MGKKILIVDDDAQVQDFLKTFLEDQGYEVLSASDSTQVPEGIEQNPDMILLDVNMPTVDGLTLLESLRSNCFRLDLVSLPVILITGNLEKDILLRANSAGADACLMKPFELDTLSQKIAQHMPQ